ncbi:MAG: acyl-CoA reductase [Sandaracinaceae bacterium]
MSREGAERALSEAIDRLHATGPRLTKRAPEDLARTLAAAWNRLADPERALGREARDTLPDSTGLSLQGVVWALNEAVRPLDEGSLSAFVEHMQPPAGCIAAPARLSTMYLAGNVFTAPAAPITLALLARTPVLVKASSHDDRLPRLFGQALEAVDPVLAASYQVVSFPGGNARLDRTAVARADVVSAFGSDRTIQALRQHVSPTTDFIAHGHGLGMGFVPSETLSSEVQTREAAEAFALDIAAYDQRGCMSPHGVVVEGAGKAFARALCQALDEVAIRLPRGPLSADVGASQMQWRGVAVARGELFEGTTHAVAYEPSGLPVRLSPGYRNVSVVETPDPEPFVRWLASLGAHLKCVGVAGDEALRRAFAERLPAGIAPRVCAAGAMQRPPLLSMSDGLPPWAGLQRFVQLA